MAPPDPKEKLGEITKQGDRYPHRPRSRFAEAAAEGPLMHGARHAQAVSIFRSARKWGMLSFGYLLRSFHRTPIIAYPLLTEI